VDHSDWVQATGSYLAGRGGFRPINPKLLAKAQSAKTSANTIDRRLRKLTALVARITISPAPPAVPRRKAPKRYPAQALSDLQYWYGSASQRTASDRIKHFFHGPR
jgi:hypothetical protein